MITMDLQYLNFRPPFLLRHFLRILRSHFPTPTPQTNQPTSPVPPFGHSHLLPVSEARHPNPELAHGKKTAGLFEKEIIGRIIYKNMNMMNIYVY